jgi:hypothetical protein
MSGSAFRRSTEVFLDRGLAPREISAALARVARAGVADLVSSGRASAVYETFVDGQKGADEDTVRPDGVIVYRFGVLGEAAAFAMAFLLERSPERSGRYRRGFWFAVDGRPVSRSSFDTQRLSPDAGEVMVYNREPYSRKLDVQLIGGRRLRVMVPPGIFDDAAKAVRRRFPTVDARRLYTVNFSGMERAKTGKRAGRRLEYPALVITNR